MSRSVFFSDRENAKNGSEKQKNCFVHTKKNPRKTVCEVFRRSLILREEKSFKKVFKGKENQEGIPGHTCFPLFSLEMKAMKE